MWHAIAIAAPKLKEDVVRLGLKENCEVNEKTTEFKSVVLSWQGLVEEVRTFVMTGVCLSN